MTIAILPPDRYCELPIEVNPITSIVVVAEDSTGIHGYWVACGVVHIEPVFLSDKIKDGGFTGLKMLQTLLSELSAGDNPAFYAFSDRPEIANYAERLGMTKLPYEVYMGINPNIKSN